jgi:hypothetical protein
MTRAPSRRRFAPTVIVPRPCFAAVSTLAWAVLACGAAGAPTPPAAAALPTADEPPIELPIFEVTDSRVLPPPERWHYAAIPGFEILSNISERETKRFVRDFLLLQEAVTVLMPALTHTEVAVPASLLLCGGGNGFNRFMPVDRGDDIYRTNSLFFDDPERAAIVVDFALSELQLDVTTTVEADPYRGFYREYFRHLIRHQVGHPPAWFEEGLVQLFSAIDFNKKWITFAQIGDGFGGGKDNDFNQLLAQRALPPFEDLFLPERVSSNPFWAAHAYAFVHMCLYGRGQRYQAAFVKFVERLANEPPTEQLFKECFNKSYKEMALELRGYLEFTDHKYIQLTAKKGHALPEPPPVALRDATEAEAGRITGEVLRLGGHGNDAHLALIAPYIRGAREPQLLAALGLDERVAGHDERAKKFLEAAAQARVVRPRVYLELARLRYAGVTVAEWGGAGLTPAQVSDVLAPLATARRQPPPMAEVFELTADVWSHSAQPPTREDLAVINEGIGFFPRRPLLLARAADLNLHYGDPETARKIITHALRVVGNSPVRLALEQLRDELLPEPKPAALGIPPAAAPAIASPKP